MHSNSPSSSMGVGGASLKLQIALVRDLYLRICWNSFYSKTIFQYERKSILKKNNSENWNSILFEFVLPVQLIQRKLFLLDFNGVLSSSTQSLDGWQRLNSLLSLTLQRPNHLYVSAGQWARKMLTSFNTEREINITNNDWRFFW